VHKRHPPGNPGMWQGRAAGNMGGLAEVVRFPSARSAQEQRDAPRLAGHQDSERAGASASSHWPADRFVARRQRAEPAVSVRGSNTPKSASAVSTGGPSDLEATRPADLLSQRNSSATAAVVFAQRLAPVETEPGRTNPGLYAELLGPEAGGRRKLTSTPENCPVCQAGLGRPICSTRPPAPHFGKPGGDNKRPPITSVGVRLEHADA
jgi:hypothetical protein